MSLMRLLLSLPFNLENWISLRKVVEVSIRYECIILRKI
jgi:hypothetical protein